MLELSYHESRMAFQWLQMRISEEKDRLQRQAQVLERLPGALEQLHVDLTECIRAYTEAFGPEVADIQFQDGIVRVVVSEENEGRWKQIAVVEITLMPKPQGFRVERSGGDPMLIEIGLLPTGRLYYRHAEQYLTVEEMTRRILDRALFPKLGE